MKNKTWLLGMVLLVGLTGCGSSELAIDEFEKTKQEIQSAKSQDDGQMELTNMNEEGIPEHIKSQLNVDGKVSMILDADVDSKGYDEAKLYTMNPIEVNDEYMNSLAEKLFDDGKYTSQLPYKYWNQAELNEEQKRFDEMDQEAYDAGCKVDPMYTFNLKLALQQNNPSKTPKLIDESEIIYEDTASRKQYYGEYEKDRFCNLRGIIDGKEYLLTYNEVIGGNDSSMNSIQLIPLYPIALDAERNVIDTDESGVAQGVELTDVENPVDETVAQSQAEVLLKKLDLEGFTLSICRKKQNINPNSGECELDGYYLIYERELPELNKFCEFMSMKVFRNDDPDKKATPLENICICITKDGIQSFDMNVHYKVGETLAEGVSMLSFEQVNHAVEDMMRNVNPQSSNEKLYDVLNFNEEDPITSIRLCYMPAEYEDKYVYMPMWCYGFAVESPWLTSGEQYITVFAVSAVDGIVYNFVSKDVIYMEMGRISEEQN